MKNAFGEARSKETIPVTTNGVKTNLAFALKDGRPQVFWYYIECPGCGQWHTFDIRGLPHLEDNWLKNWKPDEALKKVATLIESVDVLTRIAGHDSTDALGKADQLRLL